MACIVITMDTAPNIWGLAELDSRQKMCHVTPNDPVVSMLGVRAKGTE